MDISKVVNCKVLNRKNAPPFKDKMKKIYEHTGKVIFDVSHAETKSTPDRGKKSNQLKG